MIPAIAAHLWQSTVFAGAAWLAALALGTNRAQVRYWVWFTASVKFLIPFSWLVELGTLMPRPAAAPPIRTDWLAGQGFSPLALSTSAAHATVSVAATDQSYLTAAALALWACGFAAVAICWLLRWRRVHALRSSAHAIGVSTNLEIPVPTLSTPDLIEPGVFGVFRPVLLLPEGIRERLNQTQLDAILTHELCHIRRRDNLTATIHMAVQAIFWFHPLTWWIGSRLVDERERACDEEVLRHGCQASVYAESILVICKLYLSSPLACVSGVTGSDLKRRIESIMRHRSAAGLTLGRKLALGIAGTMALAVPIVMGILSAPAIRAQDAADWQAAAGGKMAFEVASVKPGNGAFTAPNVPMNITDGYRPTGGYFKADFPVWVFIQFAYKIAPVEDQSREMLAHLPKWVTTDRYSIEAKGPANATKDQMRLMMQSLLADRFKMAARFETREVPVFALTLVKPGTLGPKLVSHAEGRPCGDYFTEATIPIPPRVMRAEVDGGPENFPPMCDAIAVIKRPNGMLLEGYRNATMVMLASALAGVVGEGRPVIDKTGLSGRFDYTMEWVPEPSSPPPSGAPAAPSDIPGPTPLQALRNQLGLKLESTKAAVKILVIDRVERPSEN